VTQSAYRRWERAHPTRAISIKSFGHSNKHLGLLDPSTGLTAVTVEGVASETAEADQRSWDGVDCALYFGDKSVETANRIVVAQHKYSTTDPDVAWTIARLVYSKSKKGDSSVVRRLADAFKAVRARMKADARTRSPLGQQSSDSLGSYRCC